MLLPKNLVAYIPIQLESTKHNSNKAAKNYCDYILIDDDKLITEMWLLQTAFRGKKLMGFDSIQAAERKIYEYYRAIPIYILTQI